MADFHVVYADWQLDQAALHGLRETVFVQEQKVPAEEEWDDMDAQCAHVLALDNDGEPIGCGRLTPERKIGRMAVLGEWRGRGVGAAMLQALLDRARDHGWEEVHLNAQVDAMDFYAQHGFVAEGAEFMEAGIRHKSMRLALPPRSPVPSHRGVTSAPPVPEALAFVDRAQLKTAVLKLLEQTRYRLAVHSQHLDPALFDDDEILDSLRRVATSGRLSSLRFLLLDPDRVLREGHRLVDLAQRLSTSIELRTLSEQEDRSYPSAFLLTDSAGYVLQPIAERPAGHGSTYAPGKHASLMNYFNEVWERALPATELRLLQI